MKDLIERSKKEDIELICNLVYNKKNFYNEKIARIFYWMIIHNFFILYIII